jgi:signal transduction histidine kinase
MKSTKILEFSSVDTPKVSITKGIPISLDTIKHRLHVIQWLAPIGMALLVILYEVGPARWIDIRFGFQYHFLAEILLYGTLGPLLVFALMVLLRRWLEERETSDLQAQVLEQVKEHARISHEVTDDALQAIFASSVFLSTLEAKIPDLPPDIAEQAKNTKRALEPVMRQLYEHQAKRPR